MRNAFDTRRGDLFSISGHNSPSHYLIPPLARYADLPQGSKNVPRLPIQVVNDKGRYHSQEYGFSLTKIHPIRPVIVYADIVQCKFKTAVEFPVEKGHCHLPVEHFLSIVANQFQETSADIGLVTHP